MSDPDGEETNLPENSSDEHVPRGAACLEIVEESRTVPLSLTTLSETLESEGDGINILLSSPSTPITLQTMFHDRYHPPRRYSTFLTPHDAFHQSQNYRVQRHASLPFLSAEDVHNLNNDLNYKKMIFDSSRRSSFESAYHSQRSDPMSRTPTSSRMDLLNDTNLFNESQYLHNNPLLSSNEDLEQEIKERRDSLSYEAIRTYFLERNPYIQQIDQGSHCLDHSHLGTSTCPICQRRRSNFGISNLYFRTNAHQAVIERQFEDLSNIPETRQSRSTSIDLSFSGAREHGDIDPISDIENLSYGNSFENKMHDSDVEEQESETNSENN